LSIRLLVTVLVLVATPLGAGAISPAAAPGDSASPPPTRAAPVTPDRLDALIRGVDTSAVREGPETLFLSALGQTVTRARTYGTSFRSGGLAFGGGDLSGQRAPGRDGTSDPHP